MASIVWNNRINKFIIIPVNFPFSSSYLSVFKYGTSKLCDFLNFTKKIMDCEFHNYEADTSCPEGIILDPLVGGIDLLDGLKLSEKDLINITNLCKKHSLVNILISSFETIWYMLDYNSIYGNIISNKYGYFDISPHIVLFLDTVYPNKYFINNDPIYLDYYYSFIYTRYDMCRFIESLLPKKRESLKKLFRQKLEELLYSKNSSNIYERLYTPSDLGDLYSNVYHTIINN